MSILCTVTSLFQFLILVIITGLLVSVAAVSRLMVFVISFVQPISIFMLRQSFNLIILEVVLNDLNMKFPRLQYILRPQYAPYLNTAGTVLLGWLIVSWVSYVIWTLLAPLTIAIIAIVLICPTTAKWCIEQSVPGLEAVFNELLEKFQAVLSQIRE